MRICPIASGSSGNCIYVGNDNTHILVDAGISGKKCESGLNELGLSLKDISAVLVTHEHIDHVSGLGVIARKYHIPIYLTAMTKNAVSCMKSVGVIDNSLYNDISADVSFNIHDITVNPIHISHDAADPVAYRFTHDDKACAVMTDLGIYDDYIVQNMRGLDALLVEANHDVNMLQVGPYPYPLKKRILSEKGHLSNDSSGKLISSVLHDGIKAIYLGHLSKENNYPELAYETVRTQIDFAENPYRSSDFPLYVAKRSENSVCTEF